MEEWIVLMEATPDCEQRPIDIDLLQHLLAAVAHASPVALHHPDRYGVQLRVSAPNALRALASAFSEWSEAVHQLEAPTWDIVRVEVLTRAEFEHDCQPKGRASGVEAPLAAAQQAPRNGEHGRESEFVTSR